MQIPILLFISSNTYKYMRPVLLFGDKCIKYSYVCTHINFIIYMYKLDQHMIYRELHVKFGVFSSSNNWDVEIQTNWQTNMDKHDSTSNPEQEYIYFMPVTFICA